jgi:hypothetical protein
MSTLRVDTLQTTDGSVTKNIASLTDGAEFALSSGAGLVGFLQGNTYPADTVGTKLKGLQEVSTELQADVAELQGATNLASVEKYQVTPNKNIKGADGKRFIVNGVTMFDYLFVSYEARTDWEYRVIYSTPGTGAGAGVSEPTYYARYQYINTAHVISELTLAKSIGINLIRVAVEPAIFKASVSYVDSSDGLTYPSDLFMLDDIITQAGKLGIVVQLQNGNDFVPVATNVTFLRNLAARYASKNNVWINPANELNGANGSGNVANTTVWKSTMDQYMAALRGALPGGVLFTNPIVINPPSYGRDLNSINTILTTDPAFSADPNLIIGVHVYSQVGEYNFRDARLPAETPYWIQYLGKYCIIVDEFGIDNFAGRYDPNLDGAIPSVNLTTWAQMQSFAIDFSDWCWVNTEFSNLSGVTGFMWYAYIPGMVQHDDNTMRKNNGTYSTWGEIFKNYYLQHTVNKSDYARSLGAEWYNYAPTVASSSGTINSASASGRYLDIGKIRFVQITCTITDAGTGATSLLLGLPFPSSGGTPVNSSSAFSAMQIVSGYNCYARGTQGSTTIDVRKYDASSPLVSGAQFVVSGYYEKA